jgi:hypothetical protein
MHACMASPALAAEGLRALGGRAFFAPLAAHPALARCMRRRGDRPAEGGGGGTNLMKGTSAQITPLLKGHLRGRVGKLIKQI